MMKLFSSGYHKSLTYKPVTMSCERFVDYKIESIARLDNVVDEMLFMIEPGRLFDVTRPCTLLPHLSTKK